MAPKWETGDIAGIQQNGWKHYQPITAKNQPMEAFLNTFTHEGTPWWEWETNEAIRLAQAGKDKKAIVKSINQKRKNHYDSTHKDKVKQTAQAKKAQTYVAPVKHTKAQGEEIKRIAETRLGDLRTDLRIRWNDEMPDDLDSMNWATHDYDPRLLLCSISYPDFNRRVFETGVGGGQDIMGVGEGNKNTGIMGEIEDSDENNIVLGRRQGGVQRIYPYGPPKRDDPSTWGHNQKSLTISEWDWKEETMGREKTYKGVGGLIHETHELSFNQEPNQIKLDPGTLELTNAQFTELKRRYETRRNWFYQLLPTRKSVEGAIWLGLDELKSNVEDGAPISKITMEQDDRYAEEVEKDRRWVWTIGSQGGQLDAKFTHGGFHYGKAELYLDLPVNQTGGIRQLPPIGVLVHNPTGLVYLRHSDKLDYFGTLRHTTSSITGESKFENDNPILLKQNFAKDHNHLGENIFMNRVLNLRGHREIDIMGVSYGVSSGINMRIDHLTYRTKFGDVGGRYHDKLKDFYRKHHIHHEVTIEEMVNQTIMDYVKYDVNEPRGRGSINKGMNEVEDVMNERLRNWDVPEGYGDNIDEAPLSSEEEPDSVANEEVIEPWHLTDTKIVYEGIEYLIREDEDGDGEVRHIEDGDEVLGYYADNDIEWNSIYEWTKHRQREGYIEGSEEPEEPEDEDEEIEFMFQGVPYSRSKLRNIVYDAEYEEVGTWSSNMIEFTKLGLKFHNFRVAKLNESPDEDEEDPIEEEEEDVEDEPPAIVASGAEVSVANEVENEPESEKLYLSDDSDMFVHKGKIYTIIKYDVGRMKRLFAINSVFSDDAEIWDLGTVHSPWMKHNTAFLEEHGVNNFEKLEGAEYDVEGYIQMRDLEQTTHYKTSEGPFHHEIISRIGKKEVKPTQAKEKEKKEVKPTQAKEKKKKEVKEKTKKTKEPKEHGSNVGILWDDERPKWKWIWDFFMTQKYDDSLGYTKTLKNGWHLIDRSKVVTKIKGKNIEPGEYYGTKSPIPMNLEDADIWLSEIEFDIPEEMRHLLKKVLMSKYSMKEDRDATFWFQPKPKPPEPEPDPIEDESSDFEMSDSGMYSTDED